MEQYLDAMRQDPDAAQAELERLTASAPSNDQARNLQFERARKFLRSDDVERAREVLEAIWDEESGDAVASRAVYELARIAHDVDEDFDQSYDYLRLAIVETPPWAGADFSLDYLLRHQRHPERHQWLEDELRQMADDVEDDRMAARLHLERGLLLADELRHPEPARQAFLAAYQRCPNCAATDDALFEMGQLYERFEKWDAAAMAYAVVAARVKPASFVGTYTSHRAAAARYHLGILELLHRRDYDAAADHFQRFLDDFPNHRYTDDSAWHLVRIEELREDDEAHRRALDRFVEEFPHSRHAERARLQLAKMR